MRKKQLRFGRGFRVIPGNRSSQAAERVLKPAIPPAYRTDGNELPRGKK